MESWEHIHASVALHGVQRTMTSFPVHIKAVD